MKRTKLALAFLTGSVAGAALYAALAARKGPQAARASLAMRAAERYLRFLGKGDWTDAARLRERLTGREYPAPAPIPDALRRLAEIREQRVLGRTVLTFTPRGGRSRAHLIFTHGGGYVKALQRSHWAIIRRLLETTRAVVTVPLYPLAPEHTYPAAYDMLERVYRDVTAESPAGSVVLCGDSAGGALALGQAMRYRDLGLPSPGRVILFAPWLDATLSNPGAAAVEKDDPMLALAGLVEAGAMWAGRDDPKTPLVSPIFGELSELPPVDVFQGTRDVFVADARALVEQGAAAGGQFQLFEYPGAFHVFVGATFTPEARDAFRRVATSVSALARPSPEETGNALHQDRQRGNAVP